MKFFKDTLRKIVVIVAIGAIVFSSYQLYLIYQDGRKSELVDEEINEIIGKDVEEDISFMTTDAFNKLKNINEDVVGYLYYPSLDIEEVIVRGNDNAYYLDRSIYKDYMIYGTVFMSYDQTDASQNKTLYGHWIQNSVKKFSNLHKLKDPANYDKYKTFEYADENYTYEYEVAYVIYHETYEDDNNVPYWQGDFTDSEFETFVNNANHQAMYDTGVAINRDDNLLSLQTCITYDSEERLVIIAREVSRQPISEAK